MAVLILNRGPMSARPYHRWLSEIAAPVVVVASADKLAAAGEDGAQFADSYAHFEAIANYDTSGEVESRAQALHEEFGFDTIIAIAEFDTIRAARLRERWGLPGQNVASATAFRDKLVMKDICRAAGIRVPGYAPVACTTDIAAFVRRHGFPAVVKARNGAASMGTAVLRSHQDLQAFARQMRAPGLEFENYLMVETFVEGTMYHIDGLVSDGRVALIWPSVYVNTTLSFHDDLPLGSVMLDADDPRFALLVAETERILAALPTPPTTTFHCEIFLEPDGRPTFCEIASRTGGAKVSQCFPFAYGLRGDLNEYLARAACGLPHFPNVPRGDAQSGGWILFPARAGILRDIPTDCPIDDIVSYKASARPGQRLDKSTSGVDYLASAVVRSRTMAGAQAAMDKVQAWFYDGYAVDRDA